MSEPWRRRCPEGHCSWSPRGDEYYCEMCDATYDRLVDVKTETGPQLITDGGTAERPAEDPERFGFPKCPECGRVVVPLSLECPWCGHHRGER